MPPAVPEDRVGYEETIVAQPEIATRVLRWSVLFLVGMIAAVLLYALVTGVFAPPAPRTMIESSIAQARAAIAANQADGRAWAVLASAQMAAGDRAGAWKTIADARTKVRGRTILYVNNIELDLLLLEGKNQQVIKQADAFITTEAEFQMKEKTANAAKGIFVPDQVTDNTEAVRLFVLKGTAQGNLGQWEEAVKTFDTALQLTDTAADVITLRGWARLRAGDAVGAKKDFARALRYMPGDPSATRGLEQASKEASAAK